MAVVNASAVSNLIKQKKTSSSSKATKKNRIARPMNSFMVFAQEYRKELRIKFPQTDNKEISKMLGQRWKSLTPEEKEQYSGQAKQLAEQHKRDHPDWKFVRAPPRKGKGKAQKKISPSPNSPKALKQERVVHHHLNQQLHHNQSHSRNPTHRMNTTNTTTMNNNTTNSLGHNMNYTNTNSNNGMNRNRHNMNSSYVDSMVSAAVSAHFAQNDNGGQAALDPSSSLRPLATSSSRNSSTSSNSSLNSASMMFGDGGGNKNLLATLSDSTTARLQQLDQSQPQMMYQDQRMQQPPPLYIAPPPIGASPNPSPNMFLHPYTPAMANYWNAQMNQMHRWPQMQMPTNTMSTSMPSSSQQIAIATTTPKA